MLAGMLVLPGSKVGNDAGLAADPCGKDDTERHQMTGGTGSFTYMAPEVTLNQPCNEKVRMLVST